MKKLLALILSAALALSLVACGGGSGAGDNNTSSESNTDKTGCIVSKPLCIWQRHQGHPDLREGFHRGIKKAAGINTTGRLFLFIASARNFKECFVVIFPWLC